MQKPGKVPRDQRGLCNGQVPARHQREAETEGQNRIGIAQGRPERRRTRLCTPAEEKRTGKAKRERSSRAKNQKYFYKEEEVLNTILNDPFAKKVFEDIYSQIRKNRPGYQGPLEVKKRSLNLRWNDRTFNLDFSKGIKGWLKDQMDYEQIVHFPAQHLMPGRKVRITVEQKFTGSPKTIEITLPPDFVVGRPIRLKGLGRKLGPFTGDLLLRVLAK